MDWQVVASLITSLGFPIVACIAMAFYVKSLTDSQRAETKELNQAHTAEMMAFKDEIKEALNNNTVALTKLCERLDRGDANEIK